MGTATAVSKTNVAVSAGFLSGRRITESVERLGQKSKSVARDFSWPSESSLIGIATARSASFRKVRDSRLDVPLKLTFAHGVAARCSSWSLRGPRRGWQLRLALAVRGRTTGV